MSKRRCRRLVVGLDEVVGQGLDHIYTIRRSDAIRMMGDDERELRLDDDETLLSLAI
jgi:hypothetical protein